MTVYIVNPTAGRGRGAKALEFLRAQGCETLVTQSAGHAEALAKSALKTGATRIMAVGGDGTLSEVLQAVAAKEAELGVLPCGTGNDFARHAGIPMDWEKAFQLCNPGDVKSVDLVEVNGRPMINIAACGFDGEVGERVNRGYRWARGTVAYVFAVMECIARFKPFDLTLVVDGLEVRQKACLCAVANASMYGGGMKISPNSDVQDGQMEVVVVGALKRLELLRQFPSLFKGAHLSHPSVRVFPAKEVSVSSSPAVPVLVDGDLLGRIAFTAKIVPKAQAFVFPSERSE